MFTNLRLLLEIAVSAGLATGLSLLTLFRMPQGGSVTLVMLPLLYLSLRHGVAVGCGAGFLVGVAQYLVGGFFVHPIQLVMDYPLAFTVVALGGLARKIEYA
ncbi:MAG: energy-coupled thiamine transporter ThiT, partial [Candidatus Latescibacteria bacterium]|nr:energy-coupled thiamine transporter ThiT [Candidatus Latescibacterota bacterium]